MPTRRDDPHQFSAVPPGRRDRPERDRDPADRVTAPASGDVNAGPRAPRAIGERLSPWPTPEHAERVPIDAADDGDRGRAPLSGRAGSDYTGQSYGQAGRGFGPPHGETARAARGLSRASGAAWPESFGFGPGVGSGGRLGDDRSWRDTWLRDSASGSTRTRARLGPHTGKGPRGYTRSDARIQEDVSDELMADGDVNASDIGVEVAGGEVTLHGTVDSRAAKRRAETLVEMIPGVRDVQNALRIGAAEATPGRRPAESSSGTRPGGTTAKRASDRPARKRR